MLGPCEGSARLFRPQSTHGDPGNNEFVGCSQCWRERRRIEIGKHAVGLVEATDQEQSPDLKIARESCVQAVAVGFEHRPCSVERFRGPVQIARDQRDLNLGDDASRAGHRFFRTEGACSFPQEFLRSREIPKLRHRDAAKCERRRIVA